MSRVRKVHVNSGNRQSMQYNDKNEHKKNLNNIDAVGWMAGRASGL